MSKYRINLLFFLLILNISINGQSFNISGHAFDKEKNEPLPFANIRILNSNSGTASNKSGEFSLKLTKGNYTLVASYIGYNSDTLNINVDKNISGLKFLLNISSVNLPEITVLPGNNPALELIKKAIERKNERESKLNSYIVESYTKGTVRTTDDIKPGSRGIGVAIGADTADLKITGILENHSKAYFKKPSNYKEVILARKQSANFPSTINTVTGGRVIQNLYNDDIQYFGRSVPGPISSDALNYYDFYITDTLAINNKNIFKLKMFTISEADPGFSGFIYISDKTYDLILVQLELNRAANTGGIFDTVSIVQQFDSFEGDIFMPVDYRVFVTANLFGLAKIGLELNSILYNYEINKFIDDRFFDNALITVLPDSDEKENNYWNSIQTIPNTFQEVEAYDRIDSIAAIPFDWRENFSFLSTRVDFNKYLSVTGPLSLYHYNRVEGHTFNFGFYANDLMSRRLNSSIETNYGFGDKKFKYNLSARYLAGDYRTHRFNINLFDYTKTIFENSESYNDLLSTVLALWDKDEFRDYYYSKGFSFNYSGEVFYFLRMGTGLSYNSDKSASANSSFSIFKKERPPRNNPQIDDINYSMLSLDFQLDFRKYIEDGLFRRRTSQGNSFIVLSGEISHANNKLLNSDVEFTKFRIQARGILRTFGSTFINYRIMGMKSNGKIPFQIMTSLSGNINYATQSFSFRTLDISEIYGTDVATVNIQYHLRNELFRYVGLDFLSKMEIQLIYFLNAALLTTNQETKDKLGYSPKEYISPFYEMGFGIGHVLIPLQVEFAWKLNYLGKNDFRLGLNTLLLQ